MAAPSEAENEGLMRNMVELSAEEEVLLRSLQEVNTDMTATSPRLPVTNVVALLQEAVYISLLLISYLLECAQRRGEAQLRCTFCKFSK